VSSLERAAVQRVIDRALAAGVDVPPDILKLTTHRAGNNGALQWTRVHPDDEVSRGCCWGDALDGPSGCTCWVPVHNAPQANPCPPTRPEDIGVQRRMCGDCAFRKGSPERREAFLEEELMDLAARGEAFYCHEDMRRPIRWEHPDGRIVDGSTDDWQPPIVAGLPYRLDGRPGLLCAGWAARVERSPTRHPSEGLSHD
jgi:hypothetical protein